MNIEELKIDFKFAHELGAVKSLLPEESKLLLDTLESQQKTINGKNNECIWDISKYWLVPSCEKSKSDYDSILNDDYICSPFCGSKIVYSH